MMNRYFAFTILFFTLVSCSTPVSTSVQPPEAITTSAATGNFYIVGKDIIDPQGNVFYPIGANVAIKFTPYPYVFEGGNGGVNNHLADVKAWNWNMVRATLKCDNTTPSFTELVNGIAPTIEAFTKAKIVVMLECIDGTAADPRVGDALDLKIRRFWDEMTRRYKHNPYVWFNIYNEPYKGDDTENWRVLHEYYVNRIRSQGAENIIVADVPEYGQGVELLAERSFADKLARSCNVLFSWHAYGALRAEDNFAAHERALQRVQAKNYPLIIGEFGVPVPVGNDIQYPGSYTKNVTAFEALRMLAPRYGVGTLWWHATGDDNVTSIFALKKDGSGFWTANNSGNLTPYGQKFYDLSQSVNKTQRAFSGKLADSRCASVAVIPPTQASRTVLGPTEDRDDWAPNRADAPTLNASRWQTAYLKFDLSNVSSNVNSARLLLQRNAQPNAPVKLRIYEVDKDNWNETNAASLPIRGKLIREITVQANGRTSADVTSFVRAQKRGDGTATLAVSAVYDGWVAFGSSESSTPPKLVVRLQ